jgi:plasmid stability protein
MTVTITLPDDLAERLLSRAAARRRPAEEVALDLLRAALRAEPSAPEIEAVVARIRAAAPNPIGLRPARGALADALAEEGDDAFDVAAWRTAWSEVEAELAAIAEADDRDEGRRARR